MSEKKSNVFYFLIITFLIPIVSVYFQSLEYSPVIVFILYGIQAAAPSIAALIIVLINNDLKTFLYGSFKTKGISTAFMLPAIIVLITMFLAKIISCLLLNSPFRLHYISIPQTIIILWAFIAEELGWRGYLQPFLYKKTNSSFLVPLIVGTVWCLWHYHYFLFGEMNVPFVYFFIGCIAESYIYDYLLTRSYNNLFSAMTYHFSWNLFIHVFALNPIDNMGNTLPYAILAIIEVIFAAIISLRPAYFI